jgi:hypothetical protein
MSLCHSPVRVSHETPTLSKGSNNKRNLKISKRRQEVSCFQYNRFSFLVLTVLCSTSVWRFCEWIGGGPLISIGPIATFEGS